MWCRMEVQEEELGVCVCVKGWSGGWGMGGEDNVHEL